MDKKNELTPRMLVEARKAVGISQHALAKHTKVSRFRITMFECDYAGLTNAEIDRILAWLMVQPAFQDGGIS